MMTVYNCKVTESMVNFAIIHGKLLDNFTTLDCLESGEARIITPVTAKGMYSSTFWPVKSK